MDYMLNTNQQRALAAKQAKSLLHCISESTASKSREVIFSAQHWGDLSRVLGLVLGSPVQNRYGGTGACKARGHKDVYRMRASDMCGKAESLGCSVRKRWLREKNIFFNK